MCVINHYYCLFVCFFRITQWDWTLLLLVFYTPLGVLLLVMRIFALIQFYLMFLYMPYQPIKR